MGKPIWNKKWFKRKKRALKPFANAIRNALNHHKLTIDHGPFWRRVAFNWRRAAKRLMPLGGMSDGNQVELFGSGEEALADFLQTIESARQSVWLEMYIFMADQVGLLIRDALVRAANRGCQVCVLYDHFGSSRLNQSFWAPLLKAGGEAVGFNSLWPWRRKGPLLVRDHRKLLIIDQSIAFCSSMNIASDYTGPPYGTGRFRDTTLKVTGPAAGDLSTLFALSFGEATGKRLRLEPTTIVYKKGVFAQVLGSNARRNLRGIQESMDVILKRATRRCYLTTPYFLPSDRLRRAIIKAAKRGVDVRVLTAGLSDVPIMMLASQYVYGQFLRAGVRVYEMFGSTLHAKTATIDGIYGAVGSYNLDNWSARRNLEVTVSVFDTEIASQLEQHFQADLEKSRELTLEMWAKRNIFQRIWHWAAYQLMRF